MKTKLKDFIKYVENSTNVLSERLLNVLNNIDNNNDVKFAEELTEKKFLSYRGAGRYSYKEFLIVIKDYYVLHYGEEFDENYYKQIEKQKIIEEKIEIAREKKERKKGSGGKRERQGKRPRSAERNYTPKKYCGFRLSIDVAQILSEVYDPALYVDIAVREKHQRDMNNRID